MKVVGTQAEIQWIREALQNQCVGCPYEDACNKKAKEDIAKYGEIKRSCQEYQSDQIEYIME